MKMSDFYEKIHGDRWQTILKDLERDGRHCALINTLLPKAEEIENHLKSSCGTKLVLNRLLGSFSSEMLHGISENESIRQVSKDINRTEHSDKGSDTNANYNEHLKIYKLEDSYRPKNIITVGPQKKLGYYLLDMSSLIPVLALDIQPSDTVLDMCAAPGGKTLAILMLMSKTGQLISNEFNRARRSRLYKVIQEYVPSTYLKQLKVTNINGAVFGESEPSTFDKILVDAPCSSDRHLINDDFQNSGWSVKKSHDYSKLQQQLLVSALASVKVGGTVVYSTCTLSPYENDDVIESSRREAMMRYDINSSVIGLVDVFDSIGDCEFNISETTYYGTLVIPTQKHNWGPIFTCKILRES